MSRNPYHDDEGSPKHRRSVFVCMDVLGYAEMLRESEKEQTQAEFLTRLHRALSVGRGWLEDEDGHGAKEAFERAFKKDLYALKAFTDNIVIGWPLNARREDAESELGNAFFKLSAFQFTMILEGFFIRGAISIGDAYIDDIAVSGSALIEAYDGETKLARDPRIILTKSAIDAVNSHLDYYGRGTHAPQVRNVLQDSDGQWFLNYLDSVLIAEDEQGPFYEEFKNHKKSVESKLDEFQNDPPIFSKYAWVAGYHNYFCDLHPQNFSEEHKIDTELFRATPKLIVE